MEIIAKRLPSNHRIVLAGDFHIGNIMSFQEGIRDMIEEIRQSEDMYFCGVGDYMESFTIDDPHYDPRVLGEEYDPLLQAGAVVAFLKPIKNKILALGIGNHEWRVIKTGNFVKNYICQQLGVPYGTFSYKVHIEDYDGNLMYKIFVSHGFRSISSVADSRRRKASNEELMLERRLREKASDCVVMAMGHTHKLIVSEPIHILYMTDDGNKVQANYTDVHTHDAYIHPEHRWYVNTGSFCKLYPKLGESGYAEMFGYDPVDLGYPIIHCENGRITKIEKRLLT